MQCSLLSLPSKRAGDVSSGSIVLFLILYFDSLDNYTQARRSGLVIFLNGYVITISDAKLLVFHAD